MANKTENQKPAESESNEKTPERKSRRRKRSLIIVLVLLLAVSGGAFYWYKYVRGVVKTDDALIDSDQITISSKILGRVVDLSADEGDSVIEGELLVRLDDSDLKAQEAQVQAELDYVRQNVQLAKITLNEAQDDFRRDSIQFFDNVITRKDYDHTSSALKRARAQYAVATSRVKASEAQLAVIETQLANTRIVASASGVVARKWVVPGDIVQPGQPILAMFDLGDVWVTANFEETKLASIHPGDQVDITVDAIPNRTFSGEVKLIGAAAASRFSLIPPNNASGNFTKVTQRVPVRIEFSSLDQSGPDMPRLLPGMSVEVSIRKAEQ